MSKPKQSAVKNNGEEMSLIITAEIAYQHYLKKVHFNPDKPDEKRDKLVIRASNGGRCHRLQKYHLSPDHKPKQLTPEDMAVFRIGNVYHEEIQEGIRWLIEELNKDKTHISVVNEGKIEIEIHGNKVEGHFDILIVDNKEKVVQLIDIKTMNPRAMSYFKKDPYSKKGYMIQLGVYAMAIQRDYPEHKLAVLLSAWDKDKGEFHEVELNTDRIVIQADNYYRELATSLDNDLDDLIPIQHPFSPIENWECNYCPYNHICPSPKIKRI